MPDNLWPAEVPSFKDTFQELFATFDRTGLKVLKAIARYLKIDEDYFEDAVRDGNSVLRALHYPPQSEPTGEHIRAGAHEDINAITLAARRRGSGARAADHATAAGSRSHPSPASWSSTSATCFSG